MTNIIEESQLDYSDVLIKPKRSTLNSRKEPIVYREYKFKYSNKRIYGNGFMVANMATTGTFEMAEKLAPQCMFTCLNKYYEKEQIIEFLNKHKEDFITCSYNLDGTDNVYTPFLDYVFITTGITDSDIAKTKKILDTGLVKNLCIDIANGYIPNLIETVKGFRKDYENLIIMVGNVVTGDMVQDLILSGADLVKVGIGSGANCITRKETGVGRPQLSAVIECAEAAHAVDGMICADGGINCVGDICKAYGAGADFVMVGSLVAGTDEAAGEVITKLYETGELEYLTWASKDGVLHNITDEQPNDSYKCYYDINKKIETKRFKLAYGMSSKYAQEKHNGGMNEYRASEGIVTLKPYIGSVVSVINEYLGGLRSCMTYIGARRLKDIPKCCSFYRVNRILNNDGKGIGNDKLL